MYVCAAKLWPKIISASNVIQETRQRLIFDKILVEEDNLPLFCLKHLLQQNRSIFLLVHSKLAVGFPDIFLCMIWLNYVHSLYLWLFYVISFRLFSVIIFSFKILLFCLFAENVLFCVEPQHVAACKLLYYGLRIFSASAFISRRTKYNEWVNECSYCI